MKAQKYTELQVVRALMKTFDDMERKRIEKTVLGKSNYTDITQEDWDETSFSIEDIINATINNLSQCK